VRLRRYPLVQLQRSLQPQIHERLLHIRRAVPASPGPKSGPELPGVPPQLRFATLAAERDEVLPRGRLAML
jgi:hypothetical protein